MDLHASTLYAGITPSRCSTTSLPAAPPGPAPQEAASKAQVAAYEAINDLVRSSARDTLEFVATLLQVREGPSWGCSGPAQRCLATPAGPQRAPCLPNV
jgi:hypothetical protein